MTTAATETERKYDAPAGTKPPQLADLPGVADMAGPEEQMLEAEYFDTDDLRLIRNGITLRRRRGGSDPGWHLRLPAGKDSRREIRVPLGRGRQLPYQQEEQRAGQLQAEAWRVWKRTPRPHFRRWAR